MNEVEKTARTGVIYAIKNNVNGKVYIGQTLNFNKRQTYHFWKLRKNEHDNFLLQADYNMFGEENFKVMVLKDNILESFLNEEENKLIKESGYGDRDRCYNIAEFAELNTSKVRAKNFVLIGPDGKKHTGKNVTEFCDGRNLSAPSINAMLRGVLLSYKGWTSPSSRKPRTKLNVFPENKILLSPENTVYEIKTTILDFATEHNLSKRQLSYLVNEHIQTYKGWRLLKNEGTISTKEKYQYRDETYHVRHVNTGKVFGPITNPKQFCEECGILKKPFSVL